MRSTALDPTAGESARRIRMHPDAPRRISDPMDSRYGTVMAPTQRLASSAARIVDPTDPSCGETSG